MKNSVVRYAKLPLAFDVKAVQAELKANSEEWNPHFNTYYYSGSWTVLALRSPGGNEKNIFPELMGKEGYEDTLYMRKFPSVKKLLSEIQCPVMAARFLNLKAGAVIKEHRDAELALEQGEARLHFPVITNPDVEFYSENDKIKLAEGECWYLNANLPHRVSNSGNADRVHLVIDCKVNDWLRDLIISSDEISYKKLSTDPNILKAIEHMRSQNTEISNKLADEMEQRLLAAQADD